MLSTLKFSIQRSLPRRCFTTTTLPYTKIHVPVMLPEVLTHLAPKDGGIYCDMTFGDGGYTKAILGMSLFLFFPGSDKFAC
jgi:16S rRNA (cytosine1402-N4)-methyltransferase